MWSSGLVFTLQPCSAASSILQLSVTASVFILHKKIISQTHESATVCSRLDYDIHLVPGNAKTALRSYLVLNEAMQITRGAAKTMPGEGLCFWLDVLQGRDCKTLAAAGFFLKATSFRSKGSGSRSATDTSQGQSDPGLQVLEKSKQQIWF